jgi:hypothetical protein
MSGLSNNHSRIKEALREFDVTKCGLRASTAFAGWSPVELITPNKPTRHLSRAQVSPGAAVARDQRECNEASLAQAQIESQSTSKVIKYRNINGLGLRAGIASRRTPKPSGSDSLAQKLTTWNKFQGFEIAAGESFRTSAIGPFPVGESR